MVKKSIDKILLFCTISLVALGCLIIFGISAPFSQEIFGKTYWFLSHQILFGILPGVILGTFAFRTKIAQLKKITPVLYLANLILVFFVFLPKIGLALGGAKRWLKLGPISFQPSEFLKISLFLYLASWLEKNPRKDLQKLLIFCLILSPVVLALVLQPDISTLVLLVMVSFLMYFLADTPIWHTVLAISMAVSFLFLLMTTASYRMERLLVFLNPQIDPMGMGYQIKQAQISIGSGGIFGRGLGMSRQKFGFLPHPMSDSVFAIFAEETGLLGSLTLMIFFLLFFIRGLKIGKRAKDKFSQILAWGISLQIILQTFLNIGAMAGILPLTGIPLPFVSYGGTHIIVELTAVGLLLNISKNKAL